MVIQKKLTSLGLATIQNNISFCNSILANWNKFQNAWGQNQTTNRIVEKYFSGHWEQG